MPQTRCWKRVKFLLILGSNLDEFFMIRVADLMRQLETWMRSSPPELGNIVRRFHALPGQAQHVRLLEHGLQRRLGGGVVTRELGIMITTITRTAMIPPGRICGRVVVICDLGSIFTTITGRYVLPLEEDIVHSADNSL